MREKGARELSAAQLRLRERSKGTRSRTGRSPTKTYGKMTGESQPGATSMAEQRKNCRRKRRRNATISLARRSPTFAGFLEPVFRRRPKMPRSSDGGENSADRTQLISSTQDATPASQATPSTAAPPKLAAGDTDTVAKPRGPDQQTSNLNRPPLLSDVRPLPTERPFEIPSADHCETPSLAYAHIGPVLHHIASQLSPALYRRSSAEACASLKIWDPYFCSGTVIDRLGAIGFPQVHNVNEDFYATIADPTGAELPVS